MRFFIKLINQLWKGGRPNFMKSLKLIIKIIFSIKFIFKFKLIIIILENINIIDDLIVWIIKYFMEISLLNLLKKISIGINVIRLNSKDIQIENQELQDKVIKGDISKQGIV